MHDKPTLRAQKSDPGHRQISEGDVVTVCDGPPLAGRNFEQMSIRIVGQDDIPTVVQAELAARRAVWDMYERCALAKYLLETESETVV